MVAQTQEEYDFSQNDFTQSAQDNQIIGGPGPTVQDNASEWLNPVGGAGFSGSSQMTDTPGMTTSQVRGPVTSGGTAFSNVATGEAAVYDATGYDAENYNATGYNADQRGVGANQTVQGQMEGLLNSDNPYIKNARTRAQEAGAARGLLGSSIMANAAERAAIDAALPIASQDASTFANQALTNQSANNRAMEFSASADNTAKGFNAGAVNDARQFTADSMNVADQHNTNSINKMQEANMGAINDRASQLQDEAHSWTMQQDDQIAASDLLGQEWDARESFETLAQEGRESLKEMGIAADRLQSYDTAMNNMINGFTDAQMSVLMNPATTAAEKNMLMDSFVPRMKAMQQALTTIYQSGGDLSLAGIIPGTHTSGNSAAWDFLNNPINMEGQNSYVNGGDS